jgi:hypothetical protein
VILILLKTIKSLAVKVFRKPHQGLSFLWAIPENFGLYKIEPNPSKFLNTLFVFTKPLPDI